MVERETLIAEIAAALGIANPTGAVSAQAREEVERRLAAPAGFAVGRTYGAKNVPTYTVWWA